MSLGKERTGKMWSHDKAMAKRCVVWEDKGGGRAEGSSSTSSESRAAKPKIKGKTRKGQAQNRKYMIQETRDMKTTHRKGGAAWMCETCKGKTRRTGQTNWGGSNGKNHQAIKAFS